MTLKVKLFSKETEQEADDIFMLKTLSSKIEALIEKDYPSFKASVKIYGEIVLMR